MSEEQPPWDYEVRLFNITPNLILSMLTNAVMNFVVIKQIDLKKKPTLLILKQC